jgi:phage tail sheath gpL-like
MPAIVPVTGFPSDYRTPSIGIEIVYAQGESISGAGSREILVTGPMLASGTYTAGTVYGPIKTELEVQTGGGAGGRLHRMIRKIMKSNKTASVYVLPYAETTGGSPIQAIGNWVLSGTATSSFNWPVNVCGEDISIYVKSGDAFGTVATALRAAINLRTHLPITAAGSAGTVALTSKHYGTSGGNGTYNPLRCRALSPGNGLACSFAEIGATTAGAEGTTTETATLTTALTAVDGRYFYYYAYDNFANTTAMAALKTHIAAKSAPRYGRTAYLVSGYNGTIAAATTVANGLNYERMECATQPYADVDPAELCGQLVASMQLVRETDPANGLINYAGAEWTLPPVSLTQYWPDEDDISDAIAAGLSIIVSKTGGSFLAMSITTRSKDSSGTYADFRAAESHRVSVADYCATELKGALVPFIGKGFKTHPKLPNGNPDPNAIIPRGVATDYTIRPTYVSYINAWEAAGLTQKASDSLASLTVVKSPINAGRLESGFSLYARDNLSQITCRIAESSAA